MKLTTRGFTLVELMIVIAIIGILAAALFPSLTAYLARGRDTARASGLSDISKSIAAYNIDKSSFPSPASTNCVNSGALAQYLPKFPTDPSGKTHCGALPGVYGYGTGDVLGIPTIALSAIFENDNGGNTGGVISTFQGEGLATLAGIDTFKKGTGSGYVIRN